MLQLLYVVTLTYHHWADEALPVWAARSPVVHFCLLIVSVVICHHWDPVAFGATMQGGLQVGQDHQWRLLHSKLSLENVPCENSEMESMPKMCVWYKGADLVC